MSFVLALKNENSIYMYGDTKLTDGNDDCEKFFCSSYSLVKNIGVLKTIILSDSIALGFAGKIGIVDEVLGEIFINGKIHKNFLNILATASVRDNNSCDFVVAYKNEMLYLIQNGEITSQNFCHVGSHYFFERFQEKRNFIEDPNQINEIIGKLIEEQIDNTVGGYFISLQYDEKQQKFIYNEKFISHCRITKKVLQNSLIPLINTPQDGGYTFQLFSYKYYNYNLLALNIFQNRSVYVFVPYKLTIDNECKYRNLFLPFNISNQFY